MKRFLSKPGATAGIVGVVILLQLVVWRAVSSATTSSVWFLGRELNWGCAFRQHYGIPCPNCGMTRSVLLALHGHIKQAWEMNPAGPLLVLGALLFCGALFLLMRYQQQPHNIAAVDAVRWRMVIWTSAYGALVFVVLIGHWITIIV